MKGVEVYSKELIKKLDLSKQYTKEKKKLISPVGESIVKKISIFSIESDPLIDWIVFLQLQYNY